MGKGLGKVSVFPALSGVSGRDDNVDTIRIAAEKRAIEIGADFNVYTDGSASGGLIDGGAGVVVTRGNPTSPRVVKTIRRRGAHLTCSYEEEKRALEEAVHWLQTGVPQNSSVAVFTDSQSLCIALLGKSTGLDPLRFNLRGLRRQITIQWIPGHCNILGNEIADSVAKQACSENAQLPGVTYTSICARIRHMVKDPPIQHERTAEVYSAYSSSRECQIRSRSDQTFLEKLHT